MRVHVQSTKFDIIHIQLLPNKISEDFTPRIFCCDQACKPSSVNDNHLSGPHVATRLKPRFRRHAGQAYRLLLVLLRIGFTGPRGLPRAGELLPRLSTLT